MSDRIKHLNTSATQYLQYLQISLKAWQASLKLSLQNTIQDQTPEVVAVAKITKATARLEEAIASAVSYSIGPAPIFLNEVEVENVGWVESYAVIDEQEYLQWQANIEYASSYLKYELIYKHDPKVYNNREKLSSIIAEQICYFKALLQYPEITPADTKRYKLMLDSITDFMDYPGVNLYSKVQSKVEKMEKAMEEAADKKPANIIELPGFIKSKSVKVVRTPLPDTPGSLDQRQYDKLHKKIAKSTALIFNQVRLQAQVIVDNAHALQNHSNAEWKAAIAASPEYEQYVSEAGNFQSTFAHQSAANMAAITGILRNLYSKDRTGAFKLQRNDLVEIYEVSLENAKNHENKFWAKAQRDVIEHIFGVLDLKEVMNRGSIVDPSKRWQDAMNRAAEMLAGYAEKSGLSKG